MCCASATQFIDQQLGGGSPIDKQGYTHIYFPGQAGTAGCDPGVLTFSYQSNPMVLDQTGTYYYCGDHSALICANPGTVGVVACDGVGVPATCTPI